MPINYMEATPQEIMEAELKRLKTDLESEVHSHDFLYNEVARMQKKIQQLEADLVATENKMEQLGLELPEWYLNKGGD